MGGPGSGKGFSANAAPNYKHKAIGSFFKGSLDRTIRNLADNQKKRKLLDVQAEEDNQAEEGHCSEGEEEEDADPVQGGSY